MKLIIKIKKKLIQLFKRHICRDSYLINLSKWFADKGDETLRLNYPLNKKSIVFDLGGYQGDFAAAIYDKYGSEIYVFEPVKKFFQICEERFENNSNVKCFNFGLSSKDDWLEILLADDATSFFNTQVKGTNEKVQIKSIIDVLEQLHISKIDLFKINIEGGEFDVLPTLINSGHIMIIENLQIQFHNFVEDAVDKRNEIRRNLSFSHTEKWNYEFVWESWKKKY